MLDAFDKADDEYGTVMARFLHDVQKKGIKTSVDVVSDATADYKAKIIPALKYCDYLKKRFDKQIFLCKLIPDCAYNILNNKELEKGTRIMAFSAIGQPQSFYDFLKNDYNLKAILEFEDHHSYDREDISKIIHYAQEENITAVVTTEKDAVKIKQIIKDVELPIKIYALKLQAFVDIKDVCGL